MARVEAGVVRAVRVAPQDVRAAARRGELGAPPRKGRDARAAQLGQQPRVGEPVDEHVVRPYRQPRMREDGDELLRARDEVGAALRLLGDAQEEGAQLPARKSRFAHDLGGAVKRIRGRLPLRCLGAGQTARKQGKRRRAQDKFTSLHRVSSSSDDEHRAAPMDRQRERRVRLVKRKHIRADLARREREGRPREPRAACN